MSRAERDAAALVAAASPRGLGSLWTSGQAAFLRHRSTVFGYSQVLAGTGGRLAVQAIYFFVLANTLSLRDMGVFASVSAAGVLIGSFVGFGFQSFAFRAAAGRTALLGRYLALFYGCAAVSVPLGLAVALGCYHALFAGSIPLLPYLAVIVAEVVAWRFIELLTQVNNGLGRYGAAAAVLTASTGCRAGAALAFMLAGGGDAGVWACFYLGGNVVSAITLGLLYHPRVRLRWSWTLLRGRMWGALLYSYSYFAFMAQNEIDKIVILSIAGEHTTGLYRDRDAPDRSHGGTAAADLRALFPQVDPDRARHPDHDPRHPADRGPRGAGLHGRLRRPRGSSAVPPRVARPQRRGRGRVPGRDGAGAGRQEPDGVPQRALLRSQSHGTPQHGGDRPHRVQGGGPGGAAEPVAGGRWLGIVAEPDLCGALRHVGLRRLRPLLIREARR